MLAIIIGSLDLARRRLDKGNFDVGRYVDNAMEGARRAAELTRRMLAFSRRQALEPAIIDVNALIEQMRELFARTWTPTSSSTVSSRRACGRSTPIRASLRMHCSTSR